ncbi:MAG: GAF domain-containing protein [Pseudoalteromonas spongiae]|jgi:GAF domain-containing protein|uniref:GAF domain-containing protein n=1 Tax=Pseudoalteromonas spongiae TaxID=298657 RepID=A0ABU8ES02_9GAMM|nr:MULTISPECIES: GAF domain-containing protein [Pseudoalteromonas]ATC98787.1 GAF domain-containing protein [Pseudoalteromonas spongiae UST010723-006]MCF6458006.1 GAF domain-containing protein [Pseudoalteromonas sp. MMG024]TMO83345.1 GAF domain-containing protein [Pseudoalteromonas spongiae]
MNKESLYQSLNNQVVALIEDETNLIANLANVSALLNLSLEDINWVGFYLLENDTLVLGPFQGNPACVRIPVGKGVCGTAFAEKQTQRIDNVHDFEGHIACDAASNSEIVIPLIKDGNYIGVLDIDSPSLSRFDSDDQTGLERIMASLAEHL